MKNVKYKLELFSFYNYNAVCEHLEKMTERGWLIEEPGPVFWRYKRIEPKKLNIAVTYFPDASDYDPEPLERQRMMYEYCAQDGWQLAAQWNEMQIFYSEAEDPTPIETDPVTWVENINEIMGKSSIFFKILSVFFSLNIIEHIYEFISEPLMFLSSYRNLFSVPINLLGIAAIVIEIFCCRRWYKKAKAAAENGEFLDFKSSFADKLILSVVVILLSVFCLIPFSTCWKRFLSLFIWFVMAVAMRFTVNVARRAMKKRGFSRKANWGISMGIAVLFISAVVIVIISATLLYQSPKVHNDHMPLYMQDLTDEYSNEWSASALGDESFLLANTNYYQRPLGQEDVPWLIYTVTEVKAPFLYDYCKNTVIKKNRGFYEPTDAVPWGAAEAYSESKYYLLCYEDCIVEIKFDWEPTPEQMAVVGEKFS